MDGVVSTILEDPLKIPADCESKDDLLDVATGYPVV